MATEPVESARRGETRPYLNGATPKRLPRSSKKVQYRPMPKLTAALAALVLAAGLSLDRADVFAQGVAPGGGIGNSTGIGSGIGGPPGGTGPQYPNGTTPPPVPLPPPPGGAPVPLLRTAPVPLIARPSTAPQATAPQASEPFAPSLPRLPSTVPLRLQEGPVDDLAFLKGCWRTDVFQHTGHAGITTWCFDGKGSGRFLYTRLDEPGYFCRGPAHAGYADRQLRFEALQASCSEEADVGPGDLACSAHGDAAQCSGTGWTGRVYRVR